MTMSEDPPATDTQAQGSRFARAHHILLYFLAAVVAVWLLTGFYQVKSDQVAIVERLGEYLPSVDGRTSAGLHYHLPWPIDRVSIVSVQQQYTLQINAFNTSPAEYADFKLALIREQNASPQVLDALFDPYVVTGDKSVVHVELNVVFTIKDPVAWLQSVSHEYHQSYDPKSPGDMRNQLFQHIAQRAILAQIAHTSLGTLLQNWGDLQRGVMQSFQEALDNPNPAAQPDDPAINLGVTIVAVTVSVVEVPDNVKPAYTNLVNQLQGKQTVITQANINKDSAIIRAKGEQSTLLADARAYNQNTVQAAQGEANRFSEVLKQYENAPELTRINLAVEAGRVVYGSATRIVFAQPGQKTSIVINPPEYNAAQTQPGQ
ncbi:MAG TPA: SPFH domain-containing protein [Phycisphaerae bacterium]|nr:SPFH domain-containing protein [Phycisphaerae bacterium]